MMPKQWWLRAEFGETVHVALTSDLYDIESTLKKLYGRDLNEVTRLEVVPVEEEGA